MKKISVVPDFLEIDLEGSGRKSQTIIVKKLSVRGHQYGTILIPAPYKFGYLADGNENLYSWRAKNHGIMLEAGAHNLFFWLAGSPEDSIPQSPSIR